MFPPQVIHLPHLYTSSIFSKYSNYISIIDVDSDSHDGNDSDFQEAIAASLEEKSNNTNTEESVESIVENFIHKNLQQSCSWEDEVPSIIVNRNNIFKSTIYSINRKTFSFLKSVSVTFAGEEGVDTGGPKREYLRLLMQEVAALSIFRGGGLFMI